MPTVVELKELAKKRGLKGYSKLKKNELIKLLGMSPKRSVKRSAKKASPKRSTKRSVKRSAKRSAKKASPKRSAKRSAKHSAKHSAKKASPKRSISPKVERLIEKLTPKELKGRKTTIMPRDIMSLLEDDEVIFHAIDVLSKYDSKNIYSSTIPFSLIKKEMEKNTDLRISKRAVVLMSGILDY